MLAFSSAALKGEGKELLDAPEKDPECGQMGQINTQREYRERVTKMPRTMRCSGYPGVDPNSAGGGGGALKPQNSSLERPPARRERRVYPAVATIWGIGRGHFAGWRDNKQSEMGCPTPYLRDA